MGDFYEEKMLIKVRLLYNSGNSISLQKLKKRMEIKGKKNKNKLSSGDREREREKCSVLSLFL